jgi:ADP-heptose:LPS heptosyltransferase
MKPDTMRSVDKWVGVPMCFFFSLINFFIEIFSAKKTKPDVSKTLFIELSEMGSAIIVDPAMRKLQTQGNAELFFLIFRSNYKSLEILNTVASQNIFTIRSEKFLTLTVDVFKFMGWARRKKISCVIDLELFSRFTALLAFFSGARSRVGYTNYHDEGLYRGNIVNKPVRYNPHVHMSVNFISLVNRALGFFDTPYSITPVQPEEVILQKAIVTETQKIVVKIKIKNLYPEWNNEKIILFNVNASDMLPQRRWQPENFATVAKELLQKFDDVIIIATGAPAEKTYVQNVADMVSDKRFINSSGFFLFNELIPLYSLSEFMITNDSGPAHFAAVTDLKVFVLFGPETPTLYLPMGNAEAIYLALPCSPCVSAANHRKTTCLPRPCITTISPEMVTNKLMNFMLKNTVQF